MSDQARINEFQFLSDEEKLEEFSKRVKEVRRYRNWLKAFLTYLEKDPVLHNYKELFQEILDGREPPI